MGRDSGVFADVFKVADLVDVVESPPATHVVRKDALEVGTPRFDLVDHALLTVTPAHVQLAFARVLENADQRYLPAGGILLNPVELVFSRILLVFRGHAHVCRRRDGSSFVWAVGELMMPARRSLNRIGLVRFGVRSDRSAEVEG